MLPFCDRRICIPRSKYLPSHNRGIPVPKQPTTIGGHLRRRRLQLKILQSEAARRLGVSAVTLSRWERDSVCPTWKQQPTISEYLGYDPFVKPELGRPKGNESKVVAFLSSNHPTTIGAILLKHRLKLRKNRKEFATELRVDVKTLHNWETGKHSPCPNLQKHLLKVLSRH